MAKKVHGGRALLNRPGHHSTAVVVAEVENTKGKKVKSSYELIPEGEIYFSDCYRTISLELDWSTKAQRENTLEKIDTIINLLTELREGVVIEQGRYVKRAKKLKEKE